MAEEGQEAPTTGKVRDAAALKKAGQRMSHSNEQKVEVLRGEFESLHKDMHLPVMRYVLNLTMPLASTAKSR